MTRHKSQEHYLRDISQSDFCICPPGNGIDCHRIWECLYLGSIPITINHECFSQFKELPIIFINDWREATINFLIAQEAKFRNWNFNIDMLDIDYWRKRIN